MRTSLVFHGDPELILVFHGDLHDVGVPAGTSQLMNPKHAAIPTARCHGRQFLTAGIKVFTFSTATAPEHKLVPLP